MYINKKKLTEAFTKWEENLNKLNEDERRDTQERYDESTTEERAKLSADYLYGLLK